MAETLLAPSGIKLYGRMVDGLTIDPAKAFPSRGGGFLGDRLQATGMNTLARIFGFSYEGHYYDLPKPAIFLVKDGGDHASPPPPFGPPETKSGKNPPFDRAAATGPTPMSTSGVPVKSWEFSSDMRVWTYDKLDVSMRFDIQTGDFKEILLETALGGSSGAHSGSLAYGGSLAHGGGKARSKPID